jgi:hypothetical protein
VKAAIVLVIVLSGASAAFSQGRKDSLALPTKGAEKAINKLDSAANFPTKLDSLRLPGDSTARAAYHKADSIRSGFQSKVDSLQLAYKKPLDKIDATSNSLQRKIDSLQTLNLPTDKLTAKLDSVKNLGTKKITDLNQQVEKLKGKATKDLKALDLPPEMRGPVDKLQQSVSAYDVPMVNGKIPDIKVGGANLPGTEIPQGVNAPSVGNTKVPGMEGLNQMKELQNITNETKEISKVAGDAGNYSKDIQDISKGKLDEVKTLDKTAEKEAMKMVDGKELGGMTGEFDKYKEQLGGRPDSVALSMAKEQAKEAVMKEATNHFAGKEDVLRAAMDQMTKLKSKYSEITSMTDLTKRPPNPLKGKPLIERFIPGITLHLITEKNVYVDFNPSITYRISPHFNVGLGWNERITFASWIPTITDRVFGLRNFTEFKLAKGFSARMDIEYLNAIIPPLLINTTDKGVRDWEWSVLIGLKKEFKIFKSVTGNVQTMYRLWSDHDKVPFPDRLSVRMGFEFPMKKKDKKREENKK